MNAHRRGLLGGAAASLLASPASADAELLALCARFLALEASQRRHTDAECAAETAGDKSAEHAAAAARDAESAAYMGTVQAISETPALTLEGMRAKAEAVHAFFTPDPMGGSAVDSVTWSLILDMTGRAAA